jgi:hypothetical protein
MPHTDKDLTAAVEALVRVLTQEQEILETLVRRMAGSAMMVASGEHRYLGMASDEIAQTREELGAMEVARSLVADDIAEQLEMSTEEATLTNITARVPIHYASTLEAQLADLRRLVDEIRDLAASGAEASTDRLQQLRKTVEGVGRFGAG